MAQFNLNDYETVDSRIKRFYQDFPDGRIITDLLSAEGAPGSTRWVVRASVYRTPMDDVAGTGLAFEVDGTGMANKTSALENCETSAIGRALANIGYSGDKRASREEMVKANQPEPSQPPAEWRKRIAGAKDMAELTDIHGQASAEGWLGKEVLDALTARKKALNG